MAEKNIFKSSLLGLAALIGGCTKSVVHDGAEPYLKAVGEISSTVAPADHPRLKAFVRMFSDIKASSVHNNIELVYAEKLYFNDTFHTFTKREDLKRYFLSFARNAVVTVEPLTFVERDNDIWLQWKMRLEFKVGGKDLDLTSVGVSHLRFDENGLIVLHQDFWDGADGFYAHLPFVGSAIKLVQEKLGDVEE